MVTWTLPLLPSCFDTGIGSSACVHAARLSFEREMVGLQISFGPISWLMVGEIFPLAVRGQATALATLTNFGSNFGVRPYNRPQHRPES